jgi:HlyD family secretion protein
MAGSVLRVLRESAGPVAAGTPLAELGDVTDLEIVAEALTGDALSVRPGAAAAARWAGGREVAARVRRVEPAAFTKISALGLEEQRVRVLLDLTGPPPAGLGHDYRVDVDMVVWRGERVLRVPATATFRAGDRWAVFVVEDGRARMTPVEVGPSDGDFVAINSGLDEGDEVITQPSDTIEDGKRVAPVRQDRTGPVANPVRVSDRGEP